MSKPVQVFILMGQSNMVGMGEVGGDEAGSLKDIIKTKNKFPYLLDEAGNWSERKDVRNVRVMAGGRKIRLKVFNNEWMTDQGQDRARSSESAITLGDAIAAPVMLLKSCNGNRSLGWDLMPPGTEPYEFEGNMATSGVRGTAGKPQGQRPEGRGRLVCRQAV